MTFNSSCVHNLLMVKACSSCNTIINNFIKIDVTTVFTISATEPVHITSDLSGITFSTSLNTRLIDRLNVSCNVFEAQCLSTTLTIERITIQCSQVINSMLTLLCQLILRNKTNLCISLKAVDFLTHLSKTLSNLRSMVLSQLNIKRLLHIKPIIACLATTIIK